MVSYPATSSVQFNSFKGIRTRNGIATGGTISAVECVNIDFLPSSYDASINIQTSLGNVKFCEYSEGYTIVKGFEFESEFANHILFYVINDSKGALVEYKNNSFTVIVDNLTKTEQANGITMLSRALNTFVFTNGIEYYAWCPDGETVLQQLTPQYDINNDGTLEDVTGLALCEQDGSLVIGCNEGIVIASAKDDISDFDYNETETATKAWVQTFGKPVTAVVQYIDALLVFTAEDSTMLSGNFSNPTTSGAKRADASLGGCMSFESWCKHDKYIFFYDNNQKNVYYYMQNDYGQKVLGEPIAPEVQKYFNDVNRLQIVSYIGNNRSEIWLLSDSFKLIYDYFVNEWSERVCQDLTSYFVYDNNVYSTGKNKCYREKYGFIGLYDGEFYGSLYKTQIINLGSFSNMKEMEYQPLISVTQDFNNRFSIDCIIDGKKTKSKRVKMYFKGAVWGDDTEQATDNERWDVQVYPMENNAVIQQIKGKFIPNWYYLQFTLKTEQENDDFSITCFELKGITEETDTTGRK